MKKKITFFVAGILFLLMIGTLSGCDMVEVEERSFPVALAIDETSDLETAWLNQEEEGTKMVDYNHLKVLVLGESLFSKESEMEKLLQLMEEDNRLPRNAYVVVAKDASKILELDDALEDGIGTYLEELLEGNASMDSAAYPTLGRLYQERFNKIETLFLPYLDIQDDTPFVKEYFVQKRGMPLGTVPTQMAMLSALLQDNLSKETICFESGSSIRLDNFQNYMEMEDGVVKLLVKCDGDILYQESKEDFEQLVTTYYQELLTQALEKNVDLSNSFKNLGGYQRDWFEKYQENDMRYENDIALQIDVEITFVNNF